MQVMQTRLSKETQIQRHALCLLFLICAAFPSSAQSEGTPFHAMVDRVTKFGNRIPQEKVYVHMDNTSYFQGDTIWFKAYLRRTDTDKPSQVSHTLYVELRDPDGYLKERKQIWMTNGEGDGFFSLADSSYCFGGYYELRAYTRWQLNWGATEHPHTSIAEKWFFNKAAARDFFRDYEKLYSRVFPIYSEYEEVDGKMYPMMWTRPMRRQFKKDPQASKPVLTLFPEGGNLVAGVENRVAFEAAMDDGKYLEGWLYVNGDSTHTVNRGRGTFLVTPQEGQKTEVTFVSKDGQKAKAVLNRPDTDGVTVNLSQEADGWHAGVKVAGNLSTDSLALTLMHEGRVEDFRTVASLDGQEGRRTLHLDQAKESGVHQLTVFDTQGRVLADRLFFVTNSGDMQPSLTISGQKRQYKPHEPISLNIKARQGNQGNMSLSVRSDKASSNLYDNGSILTEMLLASEIRGFIPNPGWYFESEDTEHRTALDLLMMTQGWRRFPWQEMAQRGYFEIVHPAESTPILTGAVHTYQAVMKFDPVLMEDMIAQEMLIDSSKSRISDIINERFGFDDYGGRKRQRGKDLKKNERADSIGATKELRKRLAVDGEKLKHEVKVRADFFHSSWDKARKASDTDSTKHGTIAQMLEEARNWDVIWGESVTRDGTFRIETPVIDEYCHMTLAASDTTKWSKAEKQGKKEHQWYWHGDTGYPEFYVRLSFPYPNFVKPYSFYQNNLAPASLGRGTTTTSLTENENPTTLMKEVDVNEKKRNRLRNVAHTTPIVKMRADKAFNLLVDNGLLNGCFSSPMQFGMAMARHVVSDMGQHNKYDVNIHYNEKMTNPGGLLAINGGNPAAIIKKAGLMSMLDSVYVFTDYAPRKEGSPRYQGANQPEVDVLFTLLDYPCPTNVDRYMVLPGFSRTAEFYSPDYSKHTPTKEEADYRRTLYWNPYVQLDGNGEAKITLYNNSFTGGIQIDAQGQTADGALLWNKQEE